jgi:hypothetical protein
MERRSKRSSGTYAEGLERSPWPLIERDRPEHQGDDVHESARQGLVRRGAHKITTALIRAGADAGRSASDSSRITYEGALEAAQADRSLRTPR